MKPNETVRFKFAWDLLDGYNRSQATWAHILSTGG